jgi:S1-C subfamily serine protease
MGISIQDINPSMRGALHVGDRKGVLVSSIVNNQPAAGPGMRRSDVILSLAGTPVESANLMKTAVADLSPGTVATARMLRGERKLTLGVKIGERGGKQRTNPWMIASWHSGG